jgi:hypothetical protein
VNEANTLPGYTNISMLTWLREDAFGAMNPQVNRRWEAGHEAVHCRGGSHPDDTPAGKRLGDCIGEANPVRAIDALVAPLDRQIGFDFVPEATGMPGSGSTRDLRFASSRDDRRFLT